jgi:tRNA pseudouridine55 synthase
MQNTTQNTDGVLIIDKPEGITSHDVVSRARKFLKTRRIGHTGTLDPFATGVLPLCINRATRLVQFLMGADKEYLATMRFGVATDTGDLDGARLPGEKDASALSCEIVLEALQHFRGPLKQIPPMYSAKKVGGVKLYDLARRGEEIPRNPVEIEIHTLELLGSGECHESGTQDFSFRVSCSSGTYVRTLAEDIGRQLGMGAHLRALRRIRVGTFGIGEARRLEDLATAANPFESLIPMSTAAPFSAFLLKPDERKSVLHGRPICREGSWQNGDRAKLIDEQGELVAIADFDAEKLVWRPIVVLAS